MVACSQPTSTSPEKWVLSPCNRESEGWWVLGHRSLSQGPCSLCCGYPHTLWGRRDAAPSPGRAGVPHTGRAAPGIPPVPSGSACSYSRCSYHKLLLLGVHGKQLKPGWVGAAAPGQSGRGCCSAPPLASQVIPSSVHARGCMAPALSPNVGLPGAQWSITEAHDPVKAAI